MNKPWDCPCTVVYNLKAERIGVDKPEPECWACKGTGYDRRAKALRREKRKGRRGKR